MIQTLLKILPLDIAATLSPGIFALALILLGSTLKPKLRTFGLLLGTLIVGAIISLIGFSIGQAVHENSGSSLTAAIFDLFFAAVFGYFAVKSLISKDRPIKTSSQDEKRPFMKWVLIGMIISATNFDALFLCLNAAKEVSSASGIQLFSQIILIIVNLFFFALPIILPLLFYIILPATAARILSKANNLVMKYAHYIIFVLFILFAAFLLYRGLNYFI
jgi:hypothetical protein